MAGILGMIGNVVSVFGRSLHIKRNYILVLMVGIILILGIRTAVRGSDYSSTINLMSNDVKASKEDYEADNIIATNLALQGNLTAALTYSLRAVQIYPTSANYTTLGNIYLSAGNASQAEKAYLTAFKPPVDLLIDDQLYRNTAAAMLLNGNADGTQQFIKKAIKRYPTDPTLWEYLAASEYNDGESSNAKASIIKARSIYASSSIDSIYEIIMNNQQLNVY
jgi:Flp pilus assembly protein TadD